MIFKETTNGVNDAKNEIQRLKKLRKKLKESEDLERRSINKLIAKYLKFISRTQEKQQLDRIKSLC